MSKNIVKIAGWAILIAVCAGSFMLALPTINSNINDPSMILYFSADEGGLMDKVWYYYSGEKRDSFLWDNDYGLELVYVADFARLVLSRFMDITPGLLVVMARWIHLLSWIAALIALWYFVGYHFGKGWQQVAVLLLVSVRPTFAYFLNNLKPEPLILFLSIIALHYAFKVIENPSNRNLLLAIAIAAIAFTIKYTGLFLLPPIIASLYFNKRYGRFAKTQENRFSNIKFSWIAPLLMGALLILFLWSVIYFYVRQSTGISWYREFGFWGSISQNRLGAYLFVLGSSLISLSLVIWYLNRIEAFKGMTARINEINSYLLTVGALFLGFMLIFGVRWLITPSYFILVYSLLGPNAISGSSLSVASGSGLLRSLIDKVSGQINAFDPIIFLLFLLYIGIEIYRRRSNLEEKPLELFKRLVLLVFIAPSFMLMFSGVHMAQHHMLVFFLAAAILSIQGVDIFKRSLEDRGRIKSVLTIFVTVILVIDIFTNTCEIAKMRIQDFRRKEDMVFNFAEWFRKNIPIEAVIISDHHTRVYVPPEYKNIKIFRGYQTTRVAQLRELVKDYKPEFIYYNEGPSGNEPLPTIKEMLPDNEVHLIKTFDSVGRRYHRCAGDKFVVYKVLY